MKVPPDSVVYRSSQPADLQVVKSLLASNHLPQEDIDGHFRHFLVADYRGHLIACIGLEVHSGVGLLRSLVVDPSYRNRHLAHELLMRLMAYASHLGLTELHLLTETATPFFLKYGFSIVERDTAPDAIRNTLEFSTICKTHSTYMKIKIYEPYSIITFINN